MKKKITIELNNRYTSPSEAMAEIVDYLTKQGNECNIKSMGGTPIIEVDKLEYTVRLSQRILGPLPPQIIVLEEN